MRYLLTTLSVFCIIASAVPAVSQSAYTDPSVFLSAVAGLQDQDVCFDVQPDGTPAVSYGSMTISASGLDSDGQTSLVLPTIATAAYDTTSSPNSLGVDFEEPSFLGGNSDSIEFNFAAPVRAFGLYLIGNPSPTGTPSIPFWKMSITVAGGYFDAYSDTAPLYALESGDDVYFLGIVSTSEPFSRVTLYSDNDPAAVFSFTVDDIIYADYPDAVTIVEAKSMHAVTVTLQDVVVARAHADRFNVQEPGSPIGIAVIGIGPDRGDRVTLVGEATSTPDGERVIDLDQILSTTSSTPPDTMAMPDLSVGGASEVELQEGVLDGIGPNNIGLDIRTWGMVTGVAPDLSWIVIDDGSGRPSGVMDGRGDMLPGIKVVGELDLHVTEMGELVLVTGSVSMFESGGDHYPLIRVADLQDAVTPQ